MLAMCGIERAIPDPVIRSCESDHTRLASGQHHRLEGSLNRLKPGVAKNCLSSRGDFRLLCRPSFECDAAQFSRKLGFKRMRVHITHRMKQLSHLFFSCLHHPRVGMPGSRYSERRCQIEIFFSLHIPNVDTARAFPNDWPRTVRLDERDIARFVRAQRLEDFASGHLDLTMTSSSDQCDQ